MCRVQTCDMASLPAIQLRTACLEDVAKYNSSIIAMQRAQSVHQSLLRKAVKDVSPIHRHKMCVYSSRTMSFFIIFIHTPPSTSRDTAGIRMDGCTSNVKNVLIVADLSFVQLHNIIYYYLVTTLLCVHSEEYTSVLYKSFLKCTQ